MRLPYAGEAIDLLAAQAQVAYSIVLSTLASKLGDAGPHGKRCRVRRSPQLPAGRLCKHLRQLVLGELLLQDVPWSYSYGNRYSTPLKPALAAAAEAVQKIRPR